MAVRRLLEAFALLLVPFAILTLPRLFESTVRASEPQQANLAPCGVVDGFDFPVPDIDVSRTDFGIYRARWGGLHVGIDVAFYRHGEPVRAAARGRVTYSDVEGWDTEKGVVVLQHTFPDGTLINTLYGHMEELNGYAFPPMGACVERGDIIGAVGDPERSAPHLHYEVRTRYRHEGGPGYTTTNPLTLGWLHPVDFTYLARVWIDPAYRGHVSLADKMIVPPVVLPGGGLVVAHSRYLEGISPLGESLWRFDTAGSVLDLIALPDGRILAVTSDNQVLILQHGAVSRLWLVPGRVSAGAFVDRDRLVVVLEREMVAAYSLDGVPLWAAGPFAGGLAHWAHSGDRYAFAGTDGVLQIFTRTGERVLEARFDFAPVLFPAPEGAFVVLSGDRLLRLDPALSLAPIATLPRQATADAQVVTSADGQIYLYPGEGRSLYAYDLAGELLWIGYLPGMHLRPPRLAASGGLVHALTTDGLLLSFDASDGRLLTEHQLYTGGSDGAGSARWLYVDADGVVRFSTGYLTIAALDGQVLLASRPADERAAG